MSKQVFTKELNGRELIVETGQMAKQANGAVLTRMGETAVLTAAVASKEPSSADFFPLQVNYEEKMYARGKVPGGFLKREGRPSEHATLTARMIDRPIRPLFADGFRYEVQVINTVLSVDQDCSPEMLAMLGSSLALGISDIPFNGPIAGVTVGYVDGDYCFNLTEEEQETSSLELTVAGTSEAINMVECGALELSEELMLGALEFGHGIVKELNDFQNDIIAQVGKEKFTPELIAPSQDLVDEIHDSYLEEMSQAIKTFDKLEREENMTAVKEKIIEDYENKYQAEDLEVDYDRYIADVNSAVDLLEQNEVRRLITEENYRPDGRKVDEIRPLDSEVGLLPRAHGSGLFTRGQTQALSVATLAPLSEYQIIDGLGTEEYKRFMHHYNFPQFSVGSTGRYGSPGRREIGHGALGERALSAVIPSEEDFPYTIRLVSEVLESNGSSSQASICGSTLALMDAGVPIKAPVGGIAMGLVMNDNGQYTILTDIQGIEDHLGDMDFKVAGTREGITALQMDIKIEGVTYEILAEALSQAKVARLEILDHLTSVIEAPRPELSKYAPKIETMQINPDKIKVVIGKGGETINEIIDETGVKIDINDDGQVNVYGEDQAMIDRAMEIIRDLTEDIEVGQIYKGKVVRIEKFGAFVNLKKDQDGLVHVSELSNKYVKNVEDELSLGDEITVKVIEIDNRGRINLSRKALMENPEDNQKKD